MEPEELSKGETSNLTVTGDSLELIKEGFASDN